jgi:hypothetical protein
MPPVPADGDLVRGQVLAQGEGHRRRGHELLDRAPVVQPGLGRGQDVERALRLPPVVGLRVGVEREVTLLLAQQGEDDVDQVVGRGLAPDQLAVGEPQPARPAIAVDRQLSGLAGRRQQPHEVGEGERVEGAL